MILQYFVPPVWQYPTPGQPPTIQFLMTWSGKPRNSGEITNVAGQILNTIHSPTSKAIENPNYFLIFLFATYSHPPTELFKASLHSFNLHPHQATYPQQMTFLLIIVTRNWKGTTSSSNYQTTFLYMITLYSFLLEWEVISLSYMTNFSKTWIWHLLSVLVAKIVKS